MPVHARRVFLTASLCLLSACRGYFLSLSDLHYDPVADPVQYNSSSFCRALLPLDFSPSLRHRISLSARRGSSTTGAYGTFGCDTTLTLLKTTIASARTAAPSPEFIVVLGDMAGHELSGVPGAQAEAHETVESLISSSWPGVPVVPVVGNNEFAEDYSLLCDRDGLKWLWGQWGSKRGWIPEGQGQQFVHAGSYAVSPAKGLRMLVLNTDPFSARSKSADDCGQLAWLESWMERARQVGESVYVLGHIPPLVSSWAHRMDWQQSWADSFWGLLAKHNETVKAVLFGHTHLDEFRGWSADLPPLFIGGAISPVFNNNPSFRVVDWSLAGLTNYTQWFFDLTLVNSGLAPPLFTPEYTFSSAYGGPPSGSPIDGPFLHRLDARLSTDSALLSSYDSRRTAMVDPAAASVLCTLSCRSEQDYQRCIAQRKK